MLGPLPTNPDSPEAKALLSKLPAHQQVQLTARAAVMSRLVQTDTEDDAIEVFDTALIENGGTHIGPQSGRRSGNHQHELNLLGIFGCGPTYGAAIDNWRKAARRSGTV